MGQDEHIGIVTELSGHNATVVFQRGEMCSHCGACASSGEHNMQLTVYNSCGAKVGDRVKLELPTGKIATASLWAYAIPLVLLLLGVFLGCSFISDMAGVLLGLLGCAIGFGILYLLNPKWHRSHAYEPTISIISNEEE